MGEIHLSVVKCHNNEVLSLEFGVGREGAVSSIPEKTETSELSSGFWNRPQQPQSGWHKARVVHITLCPWEPWLWVPTREWSGEARGPAHSGLVPWEPLPVYSKHVKLKG